MNRKQLQLEVCKALLDTNSRIGAVELNEYEIAVTTTGFDVFVFDKNEIIFDASKIREFKSLKEVLADSDKDEVVKPTKELFIDGDYTIEKYKGESVEIYARSSVSKKFKEYTLYANSELGRILAKDQVGRVVGAFCPINFKRK